MKILTITLLFIHLFYCVSCNEKGKTNESEQAKKILTKEETKPLIALCQLWGFLKYHHPEVASGGYDWDMELIKLISPVRESKNETEWKKLLDNWVNSLPAVAENTNKKIPDLEAKTKPDYGELFNADYFNPETIEKVKYILNNAVVLSSHYINVEKSGGQLSITNETSYDTMLFPDMAYRLLALFRYWNIVNYYFPYRDLCDQKWSEVLADMLPDFIIAGDQEEYIFACLKLAVKIDDSHGFFVPGSIIYYMKEGLLKVPFETQFLEEKLVVTMFTGEDAYVKENIKIGDVILAIDGELVDDIVERMLPYTPASNYAVKLRDISAKILKGNLNTVTLKVMRDDTCFDINVTRYDVHQLKIPNYFNPQPEKEGYRILDNNIGYVLPSSCKAEERYNGIKKVLSGTKGIIIDMRCYPGDYISIHFLKYLDCTSMMFSLVSYADTSYPGYFFIQKFPEHLNRDQQNIYKNKIVVIVNEYTQSSAEDNVLGFQLAPNVVVIGSTTAAADGKVANFSIPGGIKTYMTGLGVYYPDGNDLQRVGVKIDEVIKPTISGVRASKDELLERAIEIIEEESERKI